ncbi:MAG TPA: CaiB/BaiF CoA-transferase family protein [Rhizomicrobium sp.]|nr:CaiB/BaiF CoA-transferase family protein [Rhizomicrobium sp.]
MTLELLKGVRVLELAIEILGNQAPSVIADLGADVIKIEPPPVGDYVREIWPIKSRDEATQMTRIGVSHLIFNRNKRSIALDFKQPEAREIFYKLLETTDVVFDLSVPGTRQKLGVDYESCRRHKKDIVYVSLSGFGATGPYATMPSHGYAAPSLLGDVEPIRQADGTYRIGETTARDRMLAPTQAAVAMLAGLVHRNNTGEGCWLETSMLDCGVYSKYLETFQHFNPAHPCGMPGVGSPRYNAYETSDGKFVLFCPIERKFWERFCAAVERPDLLWRYSNEGTHQNYGTDDNALYADLALLFKTRSQSDWVGLCRAASVPCTPLGPFEELLENQEFMAARELLTPYHEERVGDQLMLPSFPVRRPGHRFAVERPAPNVGQHNDEILKELGYSETEADRFRKQRTIFGG